MFDSLYVPDRRDADVFGDLYKPPARFQHGQEHVIVTIPKVPGSDGQPVEILECRMPARFFTVRALASENSIGDPKPGFELGTGSGDEMARLALELAQAISEGMISVYPGEREAA